MCFCFTAAESKSLYGHHYSAWFITSGLNKRPIHSEQRTIHIPLVRWMRSYRCLCSMWIVRTALLTLAALMHARNDLVSCERHRTINNATNERCKEFRTPFPYEWIYWQAQNAINVQTWAFKYAKQLWNSVLAANDWTKFTIQSKACNSIHKFTYDNTEFPESLMAVICLFS